MSYLLDGLLPVVKTFGGAGVLLALFLWALRKRVQDVMDEVEKERKASGSAFDAFRAVVNKSIRRLWKKSEGTDKRLDRVQRSIDKLNERVSILEDRDEREKRRKS